ncbi:SpoIID/LytB domain-containing protein [Dysgonomonas sp. 521]|uniref:SpoIID/LytB domain-containing protein n=1 Tax=Dysgonomonas sp. 521 TaxID=2302932 RepID=UPI0013D7FE8C|nr:SpoIID/LytB domain-containing protein [Dysgonomonas sp. 521]NDV94526.1 SpoIID/LytB domain-containing protein [Dysgonomonas sp. 521]
MEPKVSVGILWNNRISFILNQDYLFQGQAVPGVNTVSFIDGKILWNGNTYDELYFEPQDKDASFIIKDVVIGINFHWERKEDQQFRGALKLIVENSMIAAVNILNVEDYLTSVISSEMSATASLELLKAHAVISRSWLLAQIEKNKEIIAQKEEYNTFTETETERVRWYDREDHINFDVCADDHCQRYQGITRANSNIGIVRQAIDETRGQVLKSENKICDARFSKCCGGVAEEFQNCWEDTKFPYLVKIRDSENIGDIPDLTQEAVAIDWIKTRPDAFCNTQDKNILGQVLNNYDQETTDFYRWQVTYTQDELSELAHRRSGIDFGTIQELIPVQRGTSGRLTKLKIIGSKKTMIIGKELEIRRTLSESHLYSSAFIISKKDGKFVLSGAGWGHGVGLCQIGAAVMGEKGYLYDRILLHYYVGATIEKLY